MSLNGLLWMETPVMTQFNSLSVDVVSRTRGVSVVKI